MTFFILQSIFFKRNILQQALQFHILFFVGDQLTKNDTDRGFFRKYCSNLIFRIGYSLIREIIHLFNFNRSVRCRLVFHHIIRLIIRACSRYSAAGGACIIRIIRIAMSVDTLLLAFRRQVFGIKLRNLVHIENQIGHNLRIIITTFQ